MKNKTRLSIFLLAVLWVNLLGACGPTEGYSKPQAARPLYDLQVKYQAGQKYHMTQNVDQTVTQTVEGQTVVTTTQQVQEADIFASQNEAGDTVLEYSITRIYVKTTSQDTVVEVDTDKPSGNNDETFKLYSAMVGKGYQIILSPDGKMKEVVGFDQFFSDILDEMDITDPTARQQVSSMVEQYFSDEKVGELLVASQEFSDGPVRVGDTWQVDQSITFIISMDLATTYKLESFKDNVLFLSYSSTMETSENAEPMDLGGIQMYYDLSGSQTGTTQFDLLNRIAFRTTLEQETSGNLAMSFMGQEISVPMHIISSQETLIELIE